MKTLYAPHPTEIAEDSATALAFSDDGARIWFAHERDGKSVIARIHRSRGTVLEEVDVPIAGINRIENVGRAGMVHVSNSASAHLYDELGGRIRGKLIHSVPRKSVFLVAPRLTRQFEIVPESDGKGGLVVREQKAAVRLAHDGLTLESCDAYPRVRTYSLREVCVFEWPPQQHHVGWSPGLGLWTLRNDGGEFLLSFLDPATDGRTSTAIGDPPLEFTNMAANATHTAFLTRQALVVRAHAKKLVSETEVTRVASGPRAPVSIPGLLEMDSLGSRR